MVDAGDSKSPAARLVGSSPTSGTTFHDMFVFICAFGRVLWCGPGQTHKCGVIRASSPLAAPGWASDSGVSRLCSAPLAQRSDDLHRIEPIPETGANQICLKGDKTAAFPPQAPPDADCCPFRDGLVGAAARTPAFLALWMPKSVESGAGSFPNLKQQVLGRYQDRAEFTMFSGGSTLSRPQSCLFSLSGKPNPGLNRSDPTGNGWVDRGGGRWNGVAPKGACVMRRLLPCAGQDPIASGPIICPARPRQACPLSHHRTSGHLGCAPSNRPGPRSIAQPDDGNRLSDVTGLPARLGTKGTHHAGFGAL